MIMLEVHEMSMLRWCPAYAIQDPFGRPSQGQGLSVGEEASIERQQGFMCDRCGVNLRSASLAAAIGRVTGYSVLFYRFALRHPFLRVLEVNEAGQINRFIRWMPRHTLVRYPEVDFMALPFEEGKFDLVLHSDNFEHVTDQRAAITEAYRVLEPNGWMCYTVPFVAGRLTRSTEGDTPAFHGEIGAKDTGALRVHTEYGSDFSEAPIAAGLKEVRLFPLDFPAATAIAARKGHDSSPPAI